MNTVSRPLRIVWFSCAGAPLGAEILDCIRASDPRILPEVVAVVLSRPKARAAQTRTDTPEGAVTRFSRGLAWRWGNLAWRAGVAARWLMSRIIRVPYRRIEDFCRQAGIKPYITANVNSRKSLVYLASLRADLIIMTTFHQILRPEVISLPSIATLNVHCSLLPHYRGPDPVHAVLADGVTETGITVHWVDDGVDTGDIVLQERVPVGGARSDGELRPKLARVGAEILLTCIEQARRGELQRRPQVPSDLPRGASKA